LLIEKASQQTTEHEKGNPVGSPNGPPGGSPRRSTATTTRWLIARDGNGRLEPLCVRVGATRVLAVFSFEEEAEMFLRLGGYDAGIWRARESCAGELVSVLCGPCIDAKGVALDPLPEMLEDGTVGLVWVARWRFLGQLLASKGTRAAARDASRPQAADAALLFLIGEGRSQSP
jgi:hypothetical protein